jgi:hypothetical protein
MKTGYYKKYSRRMDFYDGEVQKEFYVENQKINYSSLYMENILGRGKKHAARSQCKKSRRVASERKRM